MGEGSEGKGRTESVLADPGEARRKHAGPGLAGRSNMSAGGVAHPEWSSPAGTEESTL